MDQADYDRWWQEHGSAELRRLLYTEWDPIGLREIADAPEDEYDHYAGAIARRLRAGSSEEELAAVLEGFREEMGLEPAAELDLQFARRLRAWFAESTRS